MMDEVKLSPVEKAVNRLKEDLDMFGPENPMITVKRADLALLVREMDWKGEEWSNQAALGYAIEAAKLAGIDDENIKNLVKSLKIVFDFKTIEEAAEIYRKSSF